MRRIETVINDTGKDSGLDGDVVISDSAVVCANRFDADNLEAVCVVQVRDVLAHGVVQFVFELGFGRMDLRSQEPRVHTIGLDRVIGIDAA